jgi:O-antigen/teichoic acid export membrane protein
MGFKKTFFKNAALYSGYSSVAMVLEFISTMVLSRFLNKEEYGFVAIITIFSGFISLFSNTGLSHAVIRSDYRLTYQKLVFGLSVWVGILLTVCLCLLAVPISILFENPKLVIPTLIISIQFIPSAFTIVPNSILEKNLDFRYIGKLNILLTFFVIVSMNVMAILGLSYWALILPPVVRPFIQYFFLERRVKFGFHLYNWKTTKFTYYKIKSLIHNISIFNIINYFARNADNYIMGKYYGEGELGLYNRAYRFLYLAVKMINQNMGPVLFPSLKDAQNKGENMQSNFLTILGIMSLFSMLVSVPLVLFSKELSLLLWGSDWVEVANYLPYIGAIIPLQSLTISAMDLYMLVNKERAYLTLGVPLSLILVAGIVVGSFFSSYHIVRFYALAFVLVQIPVDLYFGHYRILKFSAKQILSFWTPRVVLTAGLIFSIWFLNRYVSAVLIVLYLIVDFVQHKDNIIKIFVFLKDRFMKKKTAPNPLLAVNIDLLNH